MNISDSAPVATHWPDAAPLEEEQHVASVVAGNSHLHWAFHNGVEADVSPALFWRTPPIIPGDIEDPLPEALSRHLPQFVHDYIFGIGAPPLSECAVAASRARAAPTLSVYIVSTNCSQIELLSKMWGSVPSRIFLMKGQDFFSEAEGLYDGISVDCAATLLGACGLHGFPALVFDGGTATTYTAADASGKIMGGGIGPGLQLKLRSLNEYTGALPFVSPDEVFYAVSTAVKEKKPLSTFATSTKEALLVDALSEMAHKGHNVIAHWLSKVGPARSKNFNEDSGVINPSSELLGSKPNDSRTVLVTGGDGDILAQLLQPNYGGILEMVSANSYNLATYTILQAKHLIHYGIGAALMRQVRIRRIAVPPANATLLDPAIDEHAKHIFKRVAKLFEVEAGDGDAIYRGSVKGVSRDRNGQDWFRIDYDDGDKEDVLLNELLGMLKKYEEAGELKEGTQNLKRRQILTPAAAAKLTNSADTVKVNATHSSKALDSLPRKAGFSKKEHVQPKGFAEKRSSNPRALSKMKGSPLSYVNTRVAKDFDGDIFYGTIEKYYDDSEEDDESPYWHVAYDDGDDEDYDENDLEVAVALYERVKKNDPKRKPEPKSGTKRKSEPRNVAPDGSPAKRSVPKISTTVSVHQKTVNLTPPTLSTSAKSASSGKTVNSPDFPVEDFSLNKDSSHVAPVQQTKEPSSQGIDVKETLLDEAKVVVTPFGGNGNSAAQSVETLLPEVMNAAREATAASDGFRPSLTADQMADVTKAATGDLTLDNDEDNDDYAVARLLV